MITIDKQSGFCFGVVNAIKKAEEELSQSGTLYCLGDIVHNEEEVTRLSNLGLITINHEQFTQLHNAVVLLRAHGEPPETYEIARKNNITIIDASCPVVLRLQSKIKKKHEDNLDTQIVIYGKKGHAEVIGLEGQTNNEAVVVENESDLHKLDFARPIALFSQTTKSVDGFNSLVKKITNNSHGKTFEYYDTICRQVANRIPDIREFATQNDVVFFVAGVKSSNGKVLHQHCKEANNNTYFVSSASEINDEQIINCKNKKVGICGATSTPLWLMQACAELIKDKLNNI